MKPYKDQYDAVEAAIKAHRGVIVMPTGCGKSVAMALLINALQVRTLVVVPTLELRRQLTETFEGLFGEGAKNITVRNIGASDLPRHIGYDCLIIDEAHHVAANTYRKLNAKAWKGIYYRYFFTATPFRANDEERLLYEGVAGQVIYRLEYETAVQAGYIVPMEVYYYEVPKTAVAGYTWAEVYKELVVRNAPRNALIADMLVRLKNHGASTLCLVKEIAHGEILSKLTGIPFANGMDDRTPELIAEFNKGGSCLIGTTGVLGEGVDTKPAEYIIIAGLGKSKNQLMQSCGRGFRRYPGKESCKVILFKDTSHRWAKAHFKEQVKIIKEEYGVLPCKIIVDLVEDRP